ncbi:MAG: hypothetical protein J6S85_12730 [Methanobrevibacter sp.]|nr:hypothetical protein [Methanobrevibacter sp.]
MEEVDKLKRKKITNKITAILALTDVVQDENAEAIKQLVLEIDAILFEEEIKKDFEDITQ